MKVPSLVAVICTAISNLAFSQTVITQTISFSAIPDFETPLLFNQYAGDLSDLTNINISYSLSIEGGQFVIDNDTDTAASVTANFGASLDASSPDVTLLDNSFNQIIDGASATTDGTFNLAANEGDGTGDYDSSGPDGAILVGNNQTTVGDGDVGSIFFSDYVGSGTFTINAIANQIASLSSSSGIETANSPVSAQGFITVTYTVIPEPSSTALLCFGALGLAFRRRV